MKARVGCGGEGRRASRVCGLGAWAGSWVELCEPTAASAAARDGQSAAVRVVRGGDHIRVEGTADSRGVGWRRATCYPHTIEQSISQKINKCGTIHF